MTIFSILPFISIVTIALLATIGGATGWEDIETYPPLKGPVFYAQFLELCQQVGFAPNIVQEVEMTHTRLGMVAAKIGIAFIASSLQNLAIQGVVYRKLIEDFPQLEIALAWRKEDRSPTILKFIESCCDFLQQTVP